MGDRLKIQIPTHYLSPITNSSSLENVRIGIYYPDDRAVRGRFVAFERERRLFASTPKNKLALTGADGVERDRRLPFWFEIRVECLHDQKLAPLKGFIFDGGNDGSDYAGNLH